MLYTYYVLWWHASSMQFQKERKTIQVFKNQSKWKSMVILNYKKKYGWKSHFFFLRLVQGDYLIYWYIFDRPSTWKDIIIITVKSENFAIAVWISGKAQAFEFEPLERPCELQIIATTSVHFTLTDIKVGMEERLPIYTYCPPIF